MWSKEPEKLWAPGASGSAEQRGVSFTHRRSVLGKHCYRGRRRGSGSASSWLFLLSERRGESFAWKVEQPVRACSPHRGIWPGFRRTPGPVSTRSSPGLQHSFVLGWISEPTPLWTRRRTDGRTAEWRKRETACPKRNELSSRVQRPPNRRWMEGSGSVSVTLWREALVGEGRGGGVGWGMRFACGFADGQSSSSECSRSLFCLRLFTQHSQLLTSPTPPTLLLSGTLRMKSNLRTPPQKGQKTCIYIYRNHHNIKCKNILKRKQVFFFKNKHFSSNVF